jgi:hypothetical protein
VWVAVSLGIVLKRKSLPSSGIKPSHSNSFTVLTVPRFVKLYCILGRQNFFSLESMKYGFGDFFLRGNHG